jgi:predicted  nucleic acid-binding Zn-ribbon protein
MSVVDLTLRRLDKLEKAQRETNERLAQVEVSLGRVVEVLEAHSRHFERMEDALIGISERVDRLTTAIARGRTQDLVRFDDHERRLHALEKRVGVRRKKS